MFCMASWLFNAGAAFRDNFPEGLATRDKVNCIFLHPISLALRQLFFANHPWICQGYFLCPIVKIILYKKKHVNVCFHTKLSLDGGQARASGWMSNDVKFWKGWWFHVFIPHKYGMWLHWVRVRDNLLNCLKKYINDLLLCYLCLGWDSWQAHTCYFSELPWSKEA